MSKRTAIIISIIILIILGVIAYFGYTNFGNKESGSKTATTSDQVESHLDIITAKHQYDADSGEHIVAGTLQTPTICDLLNTTATVATSTNTVTIHFDLTNTDESCTQVVGEQRFKVTFKAPEDATINATLDGKPIRLSLVPVPEGEDLNNFDIYLKG